MTEPYNAALSPTAPITIRPELFADDPRDDADSGIARTEHQPLAALSENLKRLVNPSGLSVMPAGTEQLLQPDLDGTAEMPIVVESNKLQKARHAASYAIQRIQGTIKTTARISRELGWRGAVVATEANPLFNEVPRYSALYAVQSVTHSPWVGAAVLGGGTGLIEGAGALAAAGIVNSPIVQEAIEWASNKAKKIVPADAKLTPPVTAGIATTLGTPALMGVQQRENRSRSKEQARKQGLITVAWMTGLFAVEGAAISKGIGFAENLPEEIGAGVLSTAALLAAPSWVIKAFDRRSKEFLTRTPGRIIGNTSGGNLTEAQINKSAYVYEALRDKTDEEVHVGLYGDDLKAALNNPKSELLTYAVKGRKEAYDMPILVPAEELKWYNMELLKDRYGQDTEFYYYAHPAIPEDTDSQAIVASVLREKLESGAVIFTDSYRGENDTDLSASLGADVDADYVIENLGGGETERTGVVFTAPVTFQGAESIHVAPSIYEVWQQSIDAGEIVPDSDNGTAVLQTIDSDDAERIWEIYENPFDELGAEHPMYAGFDRDELMHILNDPNVAKIVNRVDGKISTLCFFVTDFDQCPWFNKEHYRRNYPEYYNTDNILLFPGIVTDENMRGNDYALDVIDLAVKLYAKRGSNVLVSFECTETSATYIPAIVAAGINHSANANIDADAIATPQSITDYKAIRRISRSTD